MQAFGKENVEVIGVAEIDKFSATVLAHRFPDVKNYGDVSLIDSDELPDFDVLVGGSPCQDLSISKNNRQGLLGAKSELFLEYVRILHEKKPSFFVLENVASMRNDDRDTMSEILGVEPIMINSALVTAQHRRRYYWTNIPDVHQPLDLGITIRDVLESEVDESYVVDWQARKGKPFQLTGTEPLPSPIKEYKTESALLERKRNKALFGKDTSKRNKENAAYRAAPSHKANCLTGAIHATNMYVVYQENGFGEHSVGVRQPTPVECERLQGFPDNWTRVPYGDGMMSDHQRYKQTGNAVTVPVIKHICMCLKRYLTEHAKKHNMCIAPN